MARSPVQADDVSASGAASRPQLMNWRDSIRASDNRHAQGRSQSVKSFTQRLVPY